MPNYLSYVHPTLKTFSAEFLEKQLNQIVTDSKPKILTDSPANKVALKVFGFSFYKRVDSSNNIDFTLPQMFFQNSEETNTENVSREAMFKSLISKNVKGIITNINKLNQGNEKFFVLKDKETQQEITVPHKDEESPLFELKATLTKVCAIVIELTSEHQSKVYTLNCMLYISPDNVSLNEYKTVRELTASVIPQLKEEISKLS